MITHTRLQRLLDYDPSTGIFRWKVNRMGHARAGMRAGYLRSSGYRCIKIQQKNYMEHRLAWFYVHGVWPVAHIDHVNRNTNSNAMSELRLATPSQNQWNRAKRKSNTSGYKGVSWIKKRRKWQAKIQVQGRGFHLGYFDDPKKAYAAYVAAAKRHFGAFARYA